MRTKLIVALVFALVLTAAGAATRAHARTSGDRATTDLPDDISGPQIHAVYVIPADGTDRALDTNGTLAASVDNWETWLRGQTAGRGLRLDTFGQAVDVTFYRMSETDAQVTATGAFVRDAIERELKAAGLTRPGKLYAVYYDGNSTFACGGGAWPPSLPGIVGAVYMPPTFWNTVGAPCYVPSRSLGGMQLMDFAILHELMHTMGFVANCSPHFTRAGHVSDSPNDLMYAGDQSWSPSVLDVGRDDYFNAHIAGCPDLAGSPYLEGNDPFKLTVTLVGHGKVTSTPSGIGCPGSCAIAFDRHSSVSLSAAPATGSRFAGWSGACSGGVPTCTVTMDGDRSVTAIFRAAPIPKCRKGHKSTPRHRCRR